MAEGRFFRLTNWDKHQNFRGKRAHWMKLSLDFFDDPVIHALPDSQRLAFIGVMILCGKRGNCVQFDASYIKERCSLRVTPDLDLFLAQGLIEITQAECGAVPALEERRVEEKRVGTEEQPPPPPPTYAPPAFRAEKAIYDSRAQAETKLLHTVALLAERLGRDPPGVMVEVTSYRKADGTVVKGRENPGQLGSVERVKKSLEDAEGWLADLEKKATG